MSEFLERLRGAPSFEAIQAMARIDAKCDEADANTRAHALVSESEPFRRIKDLSIKADERAIAYCDRRAYVGLAVVVAALRAFREAEKIGQAWRGEVKTIDYLEGVMYLNAKIQIVPSLSPTQILVGPAIPCDCDKRWTMFQDTERYLFCFKCHMENRLSLISKEQMVG